MLRRLQSPEAPRAKIDDALVRLAVIAEELRQERIVTESSFQNLRETDLLLEEWDGIHVIDCPSYHCRAVVPAAMIKHRVEDDCRPGLRLNPRLVSQHELFGRKGLRLVRGGQNTRATRLFGEIVHAEECAHGNRTRAYEVLIVQVAVPVTSVLIVAPVGDVDHSILQHQHEVVAEKVLD